MQIPDKQVRPESGRHSSNTGEVPFENEQVELIVFFDKHEFDETFLYWLKNNKKNQIQILYEWH